MSEDVWGRISLKNWRTVPHIAGRLATERDVKDGRAVFYLDDPNGIGAESYVQCELPFPAILTDEESEDTTPVIVVQAEKVKDRVYMGYRLLDGGNGMCLLAELELLDAPDERFFSNQSV